MKLLAYSASAGHRERVDRELAGSVDPAWAGDQEAVSRLLQDGGARVLLLLAERWPDPDIDALIRLFAPRPVVLLDLSDNGDWYSASLPACVQRTEPADLRRVVERLFDPATGTLPSRLALLSSRNDYDSALLAACLAWILREAKDTVLVIDMALPRADVGDYLDCPAGVSFHDVVEHSEALEQGWLDHHPLATAHGIDVLPAHRQQSGGRLTADALHRAMDALEARYDRVLLNLAGMQPSPLLDQLCARCDQHWLLSDQKNLSLTSAAAMAERLLAQGARPGGVNLVLAPFYRDVLPGKEAISSQTGLQVRGCLPLCGRALNHINAGGLLPPPAALLPLQRAISDTLWLRGDRSWWQRLGLRRAS